MIKPDRFSQRYSSDACAQAGVPVGNYAYDLEVYADSILKELMEMKECYKLCFEENESLRAGNIAMRESEARFCERIKNLEQNNSDLKIAVNNWVSDHRRISEELDIWKMLIKICPRCGGDGEIIIEHSPDETCPACNGRGLLLEKRVKREEDDA